MTKVAFAIVAHPDDIEFMMAGTLLLLAKRGYELHTMNIANGSCGTATASREEIIEIRAQEAKQAAKLLGATHHPPRVDDLQIYYCEELIGQVAALIRSARPDILLLPSPHDYMEDHVNVSRIGVTAAFARGMTNFVTDPPTPCSPGDMAIYHALPFGLRDALREDVSPHLSVDISSAMYEKQAMLACHESQMQWLDDSQAGTDAIETMTAMARAVGAASGRFDYAEGWQRHNHLGFGAATFDPLQDALGPSVFHDHKPGSL